MWTVKRFVCNPLQENCYVVSDPSQECIIIDCGVFWENEQDALLDYISTQRLKPVHLLATHGHLDHNFGNALMYEKYGLKVEVHSDDRELVEHLGRQALDILGVELSRQQAPTGRLLADGDTVSFGQHTLQVLSTPGHSHGSVLYYCAQEHTVFTGDTLFRMSIGRTDFAEGSWPQMEHSLHHVVAHLPKDTLVLSGHGPQSTIADELMYNPYLR